jgi:hypothetical protein
MLVLSLQEYAKTRPTTKKSMEGMLVTWIENQEKKNSSAKLMASTGWFNRFKIHQQPYNIKFTVELADSDILAPEQLLKVVIQPSKQC